MTTAEIYDWAIAWAKREALRLKIARAKRRSRAAASRPRDASPAWRKTPAFAGMSTTCASPGAVRGEADLPGSRHASEPAVLADSIAVGRARTLAEVQRAIDGIETARDMDATGEEYQKASQHVRKAISKLRAAIEEGGAADHVLIVRGGSQSDPEYTLVLRFGALE